MSCAFQPFHTAGADRLDVGDGEDGEQLHALDRLHHGAEVLDGHAVGEIARLGDRRHHEVDLDQPGDGFGLRRRETEPRAEIARDPRAGDRMVLDAALGDVVQEQRDIEQLAVPRLDRAHQLVGELGVLGAAGLDVGEHADAAQEMLVHRVVVVHVELHHRHDAAEGGHEAPEHAGLVHPPQHGFGVVLRGQDFEEQPVRFLVLAQLLVDELERARRHMHGVGMECQIVLLREMEDADQVDGVALEDGLVGDVDPVVVDDEIIGLAERVPRPRPELGHHSAQHRHGLGLAVLQLGAENGGEVADVLGDQEVVLHEALDVAQAGMLGVAEPHCDLALDVEGQPFFRPAGEEVHVAAHRPEKIAAAPEPAVFARIVDAVIDELLALAHAIDVFGDPVERVQVAQPAFAVLDVGLDQIAGLAGAAVALLALGELGGDEFRAGSLHDLLVEARDELVVQLAVAEQKARLQQPGADGHVGLGLPDALADRARGVADLEPHVPQAIEDRLGDGFAPCRLLVRKQEQQIDVRARRQHAAAVAAGGDDRHALGFRGVLRAIEMLGGELEQHADDLVLHEAEPLGTAPPVPVPDQQPLGDGAALAGARP